MDITPEHTYLSRRRFLGAVGTGVLAACSGEDKERPLIAATIPKAAPPFPAPRNPRYVLDRDLSDELVVASINNFYEFTSEKDVWKRVGSFRVDPWSVEITGLVSKPRRFSLDDLQRLGLEERLYRLRCVEAWSMAVPWTGLPLARLLMLAEPKPTARFVRFFSFSDPTQQPGVREQSWYRWPYYEGLRIDEAMHELTFVATGLYGHALPKQNGAPVRIVVPWKYGYKSPKSVVRIELVDTQPPTFWNDLAPAEYSFLSNVDPSVPHPRWSQASERLIGTWSTKRTLPFNGYRDWVAALYR
ncbi:MAG TPA: protein-methionine-sulfoxide reductase catalytic subunit MsrP [Thermoanaerobaculia bacterium]